MALMFLTIPTSDRARINTVALLGAQGITCYLRRRAGADDSGVQSDAGTAVTILVPEGQLEQAKRVLASMSQEGETSGSDEA